MERELEAGNIRTPFVKDDIYISHLFFSDDFLLFVHADEKNAKKE